MLAARDEKHRIVAISQVPLDEVVKLAAREAIFDLRRVLQVEPAGALLDTALGCAINSAMPAGRRFTTLELKVNLTRPITKDAGLLRCEATVLEEGGKLAAPVLIGELGALRPMLLLQAGPRESLRGSAFQQRCVRGVYPDSGAHRPQEHLPDSSRRGV